MIEKKNDNQIETMENQNVDEMYMRRCLQLAACGRGHVSPNPMVGAVVVCDGRIIGEGYHRQFGGPHAEVNAIASVRNLELLSRSTLYVSLEPCSHYGKTPPCSLLIIEKKIPRVVIGCLDPFPKVSGRGIALLRDAGIEVVTGVLDEECRALNVAFMTAHEQQRPYVVLKWAQSSDGFIDSCRTPDEPPCRFSDEQTSLLVHRLRAGSDAILVGSRTLHCDNPSLTLRLWPGRRSPLRVVLGAHIDFPPSSPLLTDGLPTEIFTSNPILLPTSAGAVRCTVLDFSRPVISQLLKSLYDEGVTSLLVEGGAVTLQSFIDAGYWDEAYVETAPLVLHEGVRAPALSQALCRTSMMCGLHQLQRYSHLARLS